MNAKSIEQPIAEYKQDENLQMCRRIREERDKKFKAVDALFADLGKVSAKPKMGGKAQRVKVVRKSKPPSPSTPRAPRKAVG